MQLDDVKGLPGRMGLISLPVYNVPLLLSASEQAPSKGLDSPTKKGQARLPSGSSSIHADNRCIS